MYVYVRTVKIYKFDLQNAGKNIPLSQQVRLFESTKAEMEAKVGPRAVGDLLGRSFFLLGDGSNDLFAFATAQAEQNKTATQSDVAAFYGSLLSNYSAAITVCVRVCTHGQSFFLVIEKVSISKKQPYVRYSQSSLTPSLNSLKNYPRVEC